MIGLVVTAFSILSILISCIIFHFSKKLNYKNFRASSHLSGKINEMVNSLPIINSFNAQDKISSKLIQNNRIILGSQFKTDFFYGFNAPVIELINKICFFSVIIVACILINFNDNKLGFTQLPFFIALTFLIQGPISETCGIINSFS
jgi:ABC-type bacteriocin/lantibiotic exporter with double-glycine peptidase domain